MSIFMIEQRAAVDDRQLY